MRKSQSGFALILLILGLALIAVIAGLYFTRTGPEQKTQYEAGQEGIEQAREINNQSRTQAEQVQEQLELQNSINTIGN